MSCAVYEKKTVGRTDAWQHGLGHWDIATGGGGELSCVNIDS